MKNYLAIALCLVCALFVSCTNKEQKVAVEYLKNTMKSPSSFKVVNVKTYEKDASISYDTLYHIMEVYKSKYDWLVDSVSVDSIKIYRIEYPRYTKYDIEYDAANSFGAVIRGNQEVYVVDVDHVYFFEEYIRKYMNEKVFDYQEIYNETYSKDINIATNKGEWVSSWQLGIL